MKCSEVAPELTAYHFGVVSDAARRDVEGHLLECPACLRAFLDLKRAVETGEGGPLPSASARHRLRRAVAAELGVGAPALAWWERPLAFAFAGSAVLGAMMMMHVVTSGPGAPPYALSSGEGATVQPR